MHSPFDEPVVGYMTRGLEVAQLDTPVEELAQIMHEHGISGLPVVDDRQNLVGVVTRSDLIALGLIQPGRRAGNRAIPLPHQTAREVMTCDPAVIESTASMRSAALMMVDCEFHRVFVTEHGKLAGVISAIDLTAAVRDAKIELEVESVMSSPIVTVDVHTTIGEAIELLDLFHVTGLIVTDEGQPIGMFTQADALVSRDLQRSTPVEVTYDAAVTCVPAAMKLHLVAGHVADLRVRRVVVCEGREPVGIVSAIDFARVVAQL